MTKEELLPGCIEYFNGDKSSASIWLDKYALKDKFGCIYEKTPEDMHHRLAKEFARIEKKYPNPTSEEKIFELFDKFKYLVPQGSPMFGIGNDFSITSLSNCFVIGNGGDSYGSIMRSDEEQIQLMKRRGGVGHDLSHLRPGGSLANNSALNDMAGSVLYAQRFSNSTKEVRQGDRRGALMLSMSINHPDAERFIDSKLVDGVITDANISLRITDKFMDAVVNDSDFIQTFPIDKHVYVGPTDLMEYDKLYTYESGVYVKKVRAKKLWDKIIFNAWKSAEPGVLFWNKIIEESPADCYDGFETIGVNPCAELPLPDGDSCRLLVLNLYSYVRNPFTPNAVFDTDMFESDVRTAQRLMDDLVDLEIEKIDKIISKVKKDPESKDIRKVELELWERIHYKVSKGRRTGLGITAEGDMLAALGLTYGSAEATECAVRVHKTLATHSYISSMFLASERGSFTGWSQELEKDNPFIKRILEEIKNHYPELLPLYSQYGRRNIANLTIAPAGTTSLMTQTTSGVEPCFAVTYKRRRRTIDKSKAVFTDDQGEMFEEFSVFHHKFIEWYDLNWFKLDSKMFDIDFKKPLEDYSKEQLESIISLSPYHKATAGDINWVNKINMQGQIQRWVDHSISSTTNVPKNTPVEVVDQIYRRAYASGCKGTTIYREGSRSGILLTEDKFTYIDAIKRPETLECDIYHKTALKQEWMILVGKFENKPYEIFAFPELPNHIFPTKITKGLIKKIKSCVYQLSGIDEFGKSYHLPNIIDLLDNGDKVSTRKFSIMLRHHIDPKWIVKDIEAYTIVTSFDKVIQRVLRNYVENDKNYCEHCGGELVSEDGCWKCLGCNWSKCS